MTQTQDGGSARRNPLFQCRMYEKEYPDVNDTVIVFVRKIEEVGAYVNLVEYGGIEGMILLKDLSRRKIKNIQRFIRVGRCEVASVLCVDKEKGYIDLSKKTVTAEEAQRCEENFAKSKAVHSILFAVAEKTGSTPLALYTSFAWPLYRLYGHAFAGFRPLLKAPEKVFAAIEQQLADTGNAPVDEQTRKELLSAVRRKHAIQKPQLRADIEVSCFSPDGVDAIRKAFHAACSLPSGDSKLKAKLVSPPHYILTLQASDREEGLACMHTAIGCIEKIVTASGGSVLVKAAPRVVNDSDEKELHSLLRRSETENAEVPGDDESD